MPPRTNTLADARDLGAWLRRSAGREIRFARHNAGLTLQQLALRLRWSKSKISRIERGLSPGLTLDDLALLCALVGLRPSIKFYPVERPLRDIGQIELLAALNNRIHPSWRTTQEVPMPDARDLRAADQLSVIPGCRVMVEAYRRFSDQQAQVRPARAKQAELKADRLILLLEDTLVNRRAVAAGGPDLRRSFPVPQRAMLHALASGMDPGGDGIVILRRLRDTGKDPPVAGGGTNHG
jgi:transcriptional regulator with XRE-family HTH domain